MLNPGELLSENLVPDPNSSLASEVFIDGVTSYDVGAGWPSIGADATHRPGRGELTASGGAYYGVEFLSLAPFERKQGEYSPSEYGDS